jgi:hypothetical protein
MRYRFAIAIVFSLMLPACTTYQGADGGVAYGDPHFCWGKDGRAACALGVAAIAGGCLALIAASQ